MGEHDSSVRNPATIYLQFIKGSNEEAQDKVNEMYDEGCVKHYMGKKDIEE